MLQLQVVKNDLIFIKRDFHQIITIIKSLKILNVFLVYMVNRIENTFIQFKQVSGEK